MKVCVQCNPVLHLGRFPAGIKPGTARLAVQCLTRSATVALYSNQERLNYFMFYG